MSRWSWVGLLALAGCAWGPGESFATLEPSLLARYLALTERDAGGGWQRLSSDYQVRLESARMSFGGISLLEPGSRSEAGGGVFDPARPPAGYSLCHNGHCHRDDGALIDYADIPTGGTSTAPQEVVSLSGAPFDLLAPAEQGLACTPDCSLPRAAVSTSRWSVTALELSGVVRDARIPARIPGEQRFVLRLSGADAPVAVLEEALSLPADRAHPPHVDLDLRLDASAKLFDGVEWSRAIASSGGALDLASAQNVALRDAVVAGLEATEPRIEIRRTGE